jgi:hypothetical protein
MFRSLVTATAVVLASGITGAAQEPPQPPPPTAQAGQPTFTGPRIPLKVQVTLSRYLNEKKVSSTPYMLGVLSGGKQTSLRMGIQVPVTQTVFGAAKEGGFATIPTASFSYRDVGTNIDCQATDGGSGQYALTLTVQDSWFHTEQAPALREKQPQIVANVPAFRSFHATFAMLLRDGQTMQYASAVDPISGEVMRIDVSLALAK